MLNSAFILTKKKELGHYGKRCPKLSNSKPALPPLQFVQVAQQV